jgi:heme-degrading monooxygenase HmoA
MSAPVPAVVTLDIWGVPTRHVAAAVWRTVAGRRLRRNGDVLFAKFLGAGDGRTFAPRDADPTHWAVLICWRSESAAARFEASREVSAWQRIAAERLQLRLVPLASKGQWSRREPFGNPPGGTTHDGPVAAITRARLAPRRAREFRKAVPAVADALARQACLLLALGIGESPVGLQGTLSVWSSAEALDRFAHRDHAHREAVRRARRDRWYAEELFARFAVLGAQGAYRGRRIPLQDR